MKTPDESAIRALLQMSGLETHPDDGEALVDLLTRHLEAAGRLYEVDTSEVDPAVDFHAGWD